MKMVDRQKMHDNFFVHLGESLTAMHHTIKLFSDRGLNVIVDHVLLETPEEKFATPEIVTLLNKYPVMFVRVDCDLPELERREKERGDRQIGQAEWQLEHMHGQNMLFTQDLDDPTEAVAGKIAFKNQFNGNDVLFVDDDLVVLIQLVSIW